MKSNNSRWIRPLVLFLCVSAAVGVWDLATGKSLYADLANALLCGLIVNLLLHLQKKKNDFASHGQDARATKE